MGTQIRPELSKKSMYHLNKERYFELKYLCLQYDRLRKSSEDKRTKLIETVAEETDESLKNYILLGVTRGLTYDNLRLRHNIPCCKKVYYKLYRKFFWLLDQARD